MSAIKESLFEAINPLNKIVNSIMKKLNYIDSSIIINSKSFDEIHDFLMHTAAYHSNRFDDLSQEDKEIIIHKIFNRMHDIVSGKPTENLEEQNDDLEARIYAFLRNTGGLVYPLEKTAKDLANKLRKK